jgi:hypothetical protein
MTDAGMSMPALVLRMPMPNYGNGSLMDVNNNLIVVIIITYTGSTLGEIPGTKSSRAQSEFSNI